MSVLTPKFPARGGSARLEHSPGLMLLALLAMLVMVLPRLNIQALPVPAAPPVTIWDTRPVLGYFILTQSLAQALLEEGVLNPAQLQAAREVALQERAQLDRLETSTLPVLQDESLSLDEKRERIAATGYNRQVDAILEASRRQLQQLLDRKSFNALTAWMTKRWEVEVASHGMTSQEEAVEAAKPSPRSYKIYATRYDSGGKYAVALPDMCLKFSNAGNKLCSGKGYKTNQGYSVIMRYEKSVGAEVWESGPWNVEDNYWSSLSDPQPRRMFADLAVGMPEAQAAFFNGYNGGVDQYGRKVTAPFGIDLARKVSIDIGLEPGNNDWITVSYMWTQGWGGAQKAAPKATSAPAGPTATAGPSPTPRPTNTLTPTRTPIPTNTPNPDGSIIHVVQSGEALWSIAVLYKVSLSQLYTLNGLTESSIIRPGQKILIQKADRTVVPTLEVTATITATLTVAPTRPHPTATGTPSEVDGVVMPELTATATPSQAGRAGPSLFQDPLLIVITIAAVLGTALLLAGTLLRRR